MTVHEVDYPSVVTPRLADGAVEHPGCPGSTGFREDYLVLHCLMRAARPRRILEVGTHRGVGTKIMAAACPEAIVLSLDLPPRLASESRQHPAHDGHALGDLCDRPFGQLLGDSRTFDYPALFPIDAAYIDGEHTTAHVEAETRGVVAAGARLIVWHDCDMPDVWAGVLAACPPTFWLRRVTGTRIGFATEAP